MTNDIVTYSDKVTDPTWTDIIDALTDTLVDNEIPDKIIEAAELMVSGWPTYKIARKLNVSPVNVRSWLTTYPVMALAVAEAKKNVSRWRMEQLEQQFLLAIKKSEDILTATDSVTSEEDKVGKNLNVKLLGVQAQHARYIIGLFVGSKIDVNVKIDDESPTLKATASALEYIASQLQDQRDEGVITTTVRVIDPQKDNGPMLDEAGNPHYGELGRLNINPDGVLCHICGNRFHRLDIHIRAKEGVSNEMYETIFMLPAGSVRDATDKQDAHVEPDTEEGTGERST